MNKKIWTGERLETHIRTHSAIEHLHRYAIALSLVKNKQVLDIASGEGYGSNLLADEAREVIGVDICEETIRQACLKYKKNNLAFRVGSASSIPVSDHSIDVVVSFETIEHHDQHEEMLAEIKRVLKPDGVLLISSPDKLNYTEQPGFSNPFHVKELYFIEFKDLITRHFRNSKFYMQKMSFNSLIVAENSYDQFTEYSGDYSGLKTETDYQPVYNLCLAANTQLPEVGHSSFKAENALEIAVATATERVQMSKSFKLGHFMLSPLRLFKS